MIQTREKLSISDIRKFYDTGATRDISFRIAQLKKLKHAIKSHEKDILKALHNDLRKPPFEAYASEVGILYPEIEHVIKNLRRWAKPKRVGTPVIHFYSKSTVYHEPYGVVLIISPWNYPFQLTMVPLIGAIAAGNCAVIKPSSLSSHTSRTIAALIAESFDPEYISVFEGSGKEARGLLENHFDYIFFTGGTETGRSIMESASRNLTPVTLELGGKSPVIVDEDADLEKAARRIAWGKFFNAGQTCLAPDYLLVHASAKTRFIELLKKTIDEFYQGDPHASPDYARIISAEHFSRIARLMSEGEIIHGGQLIPDENYIAPTLIDNVVPEHPAMQEEIFGPLLPILSFETIDRAIEFVKERPKPLALYYFSENKKKQRRILEETSSGGACINDTISHVGNQQLPFGGVGESGMGSYHGRYSFEAFSHRRGVLKRSNLIDIPLRYPPYLNKARLLKWLFRLIG